MDKKDSEDVKAPKEPKTPSIPVTVEQWLKLTVNKWHRRVQAGDTPTYCQLASLNGVPKRTLYKQVTGHKYKDGVKLKGS